MCKGVWTGTACPGGGAHPTGTCTSAALPTARSTRAGPEPGHLGDGATRRPEATAARPPRRYQTLPPPAGGPTCAGRQRGCGAAAPTTEPGRWLERCPAPALRGAAPSAGPGRGPSGVGRPVRRVRGVRNRRGPVSLPVSAVSVRGRGRRVGATVTAARVSYSNGNSVEEVSPAAENHALTTPLTALGPHRPPPGCQIQWMEFPFLTFRDLCSL